MTTPNRTKRGKERPAAGARIIVGGISIAAGLGLVGAMVLTAATPPAPAGPQLVRVVVLVLPSGESETTVIESPPRASQPKRPQVGVPPAPQPPPVELTPAPAPPTTTSQGS